MKKEKNFKFGIVALLLILAVGFAAISTSLTLTGSATLKGNEDDFSTNVRFVADSDQTKKATIDSTVDEHDSGNTVSVEGDGKKLNFTIPVIDTLNEEVTVTYYVENLSQYKAKLAKPTCSTQNDGDLLEYLDITPGDEYNDYTLEAGSESSPYQATTAGTIKIKLKKSYSSSNPGTANITCTLNATAEDATSE